MIAPPQSAKPRAMKFDPPIGEPPAVQFIGCERLAVDRSYQRGTQSDSSQRLINQIAAKWDWRLCTPLLIASRDGALYIIDGQHRWEAAKLRGDIQFMPCAVGNYSGSAEEAALFVAANRHRVTVSRMDMWRAALACGDEATVAIDLLVREAGLAIARSTHYATLKPNELLCTKGLYTAFRLHGPQRLSATLNQLGEAFRGQVMSHSGTLFSAVLGFFVSPPADFDPDKLTEALGASSADEWTTHPALAGITGAERAKKLRELVAEVMAMLEDDEEEVAAAA